MQAMQAKIEGAKVSLTGLTRASRQVGDALTAVMGPELSALKVSTKVNSRAGIEAIVLDRMASTLGRIDDPTSRGLWINNIVDCIEECVIKVTTRGRLTWTSRSLIKYTRSQGY